MITDRNSGDETIVEIWVNCPDKETASAIADRIVGERLAACANIYPPIQSRYHWKGKVEHAREIPLLFKTRKSLFERLAEHVAAIHPYETPSVIGKEVQQVYGPYRAWIVEETSS